MNSRESEKVVNLSEDLFKGEVLERGFIQKIISKKWLIVRRAFLFLFGMIFYLVVSSL